MYHLYAQYFHPSSLQERVRDVAFYRRPRTIFKGYRVPDWATSQSRHGWELDVYSRKAWDEALHDFHSEATPMQFWGSRVEPNPLNWFRGEQFGKGFSSRLFYNELPNPWWYRHQGHMDMEQRDDILYSFTHGDEHQRINFGLDTTTEEGRKAFQAIVDELVALTPELYKDSKVVFPHEMPKAVPSEAHFQRIWKYYREHSLRTAISSKCSAADAEKALKFLGKKNHLSVSQYCLGVMGVKDLSNDEGFQATQRCFKAIGLDLHLNKLTAEHYESQFWSTFDYQFSLTEADMRTQLPLLISDPANRSHAEALMGEKTQRLSS